MTAAPPPRATVTDMPDASALPVIVRIWCRPAEGWEATGQPLASCTDERCQTPSAGGRPPAGWVAVKRTDSPTIWCCSYRCASIVCLRSELATGDTGAPR